MPDPTRIWRVIVSVLLIVLVLATTMGMVCHHHDQCSSGNCMLCHMIIAPPASASGDRLDPGHRGMRGPEKWLRFAMQGE